MASGMYARARCPKPRLDNSLFNPPKGLQNPRILVAVLSVCERIADAFISCEAKLAFVIYLWYLKKKGMEFITVGTTYVYDSFFRPYVAKHETEIDRNLLELRTRAGDTTYVAAQSTPSPRPAQTNEVGTCIVLNPTITYTTCVLSSLIKYGTKKSEEVNASG
ncbi:HVA22-like protein i [Glycine soja]